MRRKFLKFSLVVFLIFSFQHSVVFAISSNGGTVNGHMNNRFGDITDSTTIDGWHSSIGYWRFNFDDWTKDFRVDDKDVPNYFSGTQKTFNQNLDITKTLPTEVQKFIKVYGKNRLGIKFTVGKNGSILGNDIGYELSDTSIKLIFRPIMKYNRYNMWEYYNSSVWNNMWSKVHTAEVTDGYGENYVSVRGGAIGLRLYPNIMRSAYKASDGTLRFTSSDTTTLGDGTSVIAKNEVGTSTFWGGGASGIYFRYPISIEFYDVNITASCSVSNVVKIGSTYWVKSGSDFTINTKGTPSQNDSVVRPTQNTIKIDSNGSTQWIDMRKTASSNTVQQSESNTANHVNFSSSKISSSTESNGTFNANANVNISGDKDITISSMTRLNNFSNGVWDTSKLYKTSAYTGTIIVKSDSKAPNITANESYGWTRDNVSISASASDERSGVSSIEIYNVSGTKVASGTGSTSYTVTTEGITSYTVKSTDKVGNSSSKTTTVKIDKTAPTISANESYGWTRDNVSISASASDSASGMSSVEIYNSSGTKVASGTSSASYTVTTEGITTYTVRATDKVGNMSNKTVTVKIDKTAPLGIVNKNFNNETLDFDINVSNVIETGSGVKSIKVEYFPIEDPKKIISKDLVFQNNKYVGEKVNLYDLLGNVDKVGIKVIAEDNVGNTSILTNDQIDMFNIIATIERVLTPHDPIFKNGEKGLLKITVYGGVDKVKVTFPSELSTLDDSLDKEYILTPKKSDSINQEFYIPLDAPSKEYMVQVKGFKNGREKIVYPRLTTNGSILNDIRTRILYNRK